MSVSFPLVFSLQIDIKNIFKEEENDQKIMNIAHEDYVQKTLALTMNSAAYCAEASLENRLNYLERNTLFCERQKERYQLLNAAKERLEFLHQDTRLIEAHLQTLKDKIIKLENIVNSHLRRHAIEWAQKWPAWIKAIPVAQESS